MRPYIGMDRTQEPQATRLLLLLAGVGVKENPGRDDDAQDQDEEHDLIKKCPAAQHSTSPSIKSISTQKQHDRCSCTDYNTAPTDLSTDHPAHHGDQADSLGHVVEKLGRTVSLFVGHAL